MSQLQMRCSEHPKYNGIYAPKVNCITCWKIYAAKLELKLQAQKLKLINNACYTEGTWRI